MKITSKSLEETTELKLNWLKLEDLIQVIVQEQKTIDVLMLANANIEALEKL